MRDWTHLGDMAAHGMRELEQVAQLASEHQDKTMTVAGNALLADLDSVERWTRYIAEKLASKAGQR